MCADHFPFLALPDGKLGAALTWPRVRSQMQNLQRALRVSWALSDPPSGCVVWTEGRVMHTQNVEDVLVHVCFPHCLVCPRQNRCRKIEPIAVHPGGGAASGLRGCEKQSTIGDRLTSVPSPRLPIHCTGKGRKKSNERPRVGQILMQRDLFLRRLHFPVSEDRSTPAGSARHLPDHLG
jgi:hypothetical protein